jgi:trehalose synthase-fused probable maltokinase
LHDAVYDSAFRAALLMGMRQGVSGFMRGECSGLLDALGEPGESRVLHAEQSNTSIIYGGRLFLKMFRRLQAGVNPDAEISRYLGARGFAHTPPFGGALDLCLGDETMPLALLLGCVENEGDAWAWALGELKNHFSQGTPVRLDRIALLGQRTAELHLALAEGEEPDFAPEPLTAEDFATLAQSTSTRMDNIFAALRTRAGDDLSAAVLARESEARARIAKLASAPPSAVKTRHHGDYHLGQVLATHDDWMIIDFEGEPLRSLPERRAKRSPLRDVAGMLRSFHYAAHAARPESVSIEVAEQWNAAACEAFLERYLAVAAGAPFLPRDEADRDALLAAFVIEKVLYEIDYELNNRPAWLPIPLRGFLRVIN